MNKLYRVYWSDETNEDYLCNMFGEVANRLWESQDRIIVKIELIANAVNKGV